MTTALSPALTMVLRSARDDLNARFAAAKRVRPALDGDAFAAFLRDVVDPLVAAVDAARADRAAGVALCAYDMALDLLGQALAGPGARTAVIEAVWRRVAPAAASLVAEDPVRVLGSLSNAVHHIAATPGARPDDWLDRMERLAPRCADVDELLCLGQVAAWHAGMAHYRAGALAAAAQLPPPLALDAVGASAGSRWDDVRARLHADPWFDPGDGRDRGPRVVARAGAFRGFGGLFAEPPRLATAADHLLVRAGGECWLLTADAFGATFHRATPEEADTGPAPPPSGVEVDGHRVVVGGVTLELPELGPVRDVVTTPTTVAVASPLSHAVVLIARA